MLIRSALAGLMEDVLPPQAAPRYETYEDRPAYSWGQNGVVAHQDPQISVELAEHSEEELEQIARLLLLRAATRVRPGDAWQVLAEWDLPLVHTLEIPDLLVAAGGEIERGDTILALTDPGFLGILVRQGDLSSILIFNSMGVLRLDPNADPGAYPRAPRRPVFREPRVTRQQRFRSENRAKALLFRFLTREQKWELRAFRRVSVTGQDGRTYRIYAWQGMNVRLVEDEKETWTFCVVPKADTPLPVLDLILAQKVLLERNIEEFFKIAVRRENGSRII